MSAHLLPVTLAWLARLPDGVLLTGRGPSGLRRTGRLRVRLADGVERWPSVDCEPCWVWAYVLTDLALVTDDPLTAAAVAARIVRPWLDVTLDTSSVLAVVLGSCRPSAVLGVVEAVERMQPLTPDQIDTLARLARAAMEAS